MKFEINESENSIDILEGFAVLERVSESGTTLHRTFLDVHFD